MAHRELKQRAIELRCKGYSYSQIKLALGVSKSTLHYWLYAMPLSKERIRALQADSPVRIEHYCNTMRKKREKKFLTVYKAVKIQIGKLTNREVFLAGFFLYWGEGTKRNAGTVVMTNTNPYMLLFFIRWLKIVKISVRKIRIRLHLYVDMNVEENMRFWSKILSIPVKQFMKPYIKPNPKTSITYKNGFGKGTCSIIVNSADLHKRILMGIKYLEEIS